MVTELKDDWFEVLTQERIAIVKCYANWCGPCKFYAPHFQKFSENLSVYNDTEIKYYQSNSDVLTDLKFKYKVNTLPSTLFLVHGVLVYKLQGITRSSVFEDLIDKTLKVEYKIEKKG